MIQEYLLYLSWNRLPARMPSTRAEAERMLDDIDAHARENPHWDAWEALDELIGSDPETAWAVTVNLVARCHELELGSLGADPLETFIWRHHATFADRAEDLIVSDARFREAFTFVRTGGVPLAVQRRLNTALEATGVDPNTLVEFDEEIPDEP